jgi:hypothetical protein
VETHSQPLRDALLPFNFKGANPVTFSLIQFLLTGMQDITSVKDVTTGDMPANAPATTALINQEEGRKVFTSIYKRIYRAFDKELRKLFGLNRKYLNPREYFRVLDRAEEVFLADYQDGTDVQPTADPSVSSQSQQMAQAQALIPFMNDPMFNGYEVRKRYIEAMNVNDVQGILPDPSQQPPDQMQIMQQQMAMQAMAADLETKMMELRKMEAEIKETASKTIRNLADAESKEVGTQLDVYQAQSEELGNDEERGGRVATASGDRGVQETPQGVPGGNSQP